MVTKDCRCVGFFVFLNSLQPGHLHRAQHPGSFTCPCGLAPKGQWGCVTTNTFVCSQELGPWCCTLGSSKAERLSRRAFLPPGWTGPLVWVPSSREVRSEPQRKEDHICLNEEERTQSKLSLTLHRGQKSTCGSQLRPPWPVGPGSCLGRTRYPNPEAENGARFLLWGACFLLAPRFIHVIPPCL